MIYTFKPGWWASFSAGYGQGGENTISGVKKDDTSKARYVALSLGVPISARQSLKFTYYTSDTHIATGSNTDALIAAWSINWGGK